MKVSYEGYLYSAWQNDEFVAVELQSVRTLPIKALKRLQYKNVRVTIEEIPDNRVPISCMPEMVMA